MKRKLFFLVSILVLSLSLVSFSFSNDNKTSQNQAKTDNKNNIDKGLSEIFAEFSKLLPEGFSEDIDGIAGVEGIGELLNFLKGALVGEDDKVLKTFLRFIGIAFIFVFAELFSADAGELSAGVRSAVSVCLSIPVLFFAKDVILEVKAGLASGSEFFSGLIPIISSVLAVGTGAATSAVSSAGMSISLSFISGFLSENLLPVASLIFSVSLISNFDTGQGISSVAKGIRGWFNFGIGLVSLLLVAVLSFQCAITASADTMALRGVKYAASNMIPIVGSVVSGAVSTLASGVKMLSSSIGALSSAVILLYMGMPLISLLFYRLAIGSAVTVCSLSGASWGQRFFEAARSALDCIIGILASSLLVYLLEIIMFITLAGKIV